MGNLQGYEILVIVLLVVLLFGAKKLPEAARGVGRSLRIFKAEVKQPDDPLADSQTGSTAVSPAAITPAALPAPMPPVTAVQVPVQSPVPAPAPAYEQMASSTGEPVPSNADSTSVQAVTEHFYGQERSDR